MTKHLRFLMLFVVTIMCSRGGGGIAKYGKR